VWALKGYGELLVQPATLLKVAGLQLKEAVVADKFEEIKEQARRGRYGGHAGSLTVLKFEDVTWLFREIERLREDNRRLSSAPEQVRE
jgi:hypothetical protein